MYDVADIPHLPMGVLLRSLISQKALAVAAHGFFSHIYRDRRRRIVVLLVAYGLAFWATSHVVSLHHIPERTAVKELWRWAIPAISASIALVVLRVPLAVLRIERERRHRAAKRLCEMLDRQCARLASMDTAQIARYIDNDLVTELIEQARTRTGELCIMTPSLFYLIADKLLPRIQDTHEAGDLIRVRAELVATRSRDLCQAVASCSGHVHFVLPDFADDQVRLGILARSERIGIPESLVRAGFREAQKCVRNIRRQRLRSAGRLRTSLHWSPVVPGHRIMIVGGSRIYVQAMPHGEHGIQQSVICVEQTAHPREVADIVDTVRALHWLL